MGAQLPRRAAALAAAETEVRNCLTNPSPPTAALLRRAPQSDAADQNASHKNYPSNQEDHETINLMQLRKMSVDGDHREPGKGHRDNESRQSRRRQIETPDRPRVRHAKLPSNAGRMLAAANGSGTSGDQEAGRCRSLGRSPLPRRAGTALPWNNARRRRLVYVPAGFGSLPSAPPFPGGPSGRIIADFSNGRCQREAHFQGEG
jgi:hypothetical protein